MTDQLELFPKSDEDRIRELLEALERYGEHGFYCEWDPEAGLFNRELGCTCGLEEILSEEKNRV